jgi:L-ascorbate metabolism protein UlaG (beta-lactamase superfamily)
MRISKYIHSCLLIEKGKDKILFDPGKFSFIEGLVKPEQFEHLSAIVLTHQHPDHIDDEALAKILSNNASAGVLANTEIRTRLAQKGIATEVFETGTRALGSFMLAAFDAPHAPLLNATTPQNTAYLVDNSFLHPGDSFSDRLDAVKNTSALALPVMAPWNTELEVAAFADRIRPRQIIPIHDGYVKDFFRRLRYDNYENYFSKQGIEFLRLDQPGASVEVESR